MARYSHSMRVAALVSASPTWAALSPANHQPAVMELSIINAVATTHVLGVGRSANVPTLSVVRTFVPPNESRPSISLTEAGNDFAIAPTVPAQFFRRASLPAVVGIGITYTFPKGIVLAAGGAALVLWCITAATPVPLDIHCSVSE
jgi:hypothetical protein